MKTKVFLFAIMILSISVKAQYSVSVNYGNVDWIPKSNKVLVYENIFIYQSYSFGKSGLSLFEATSLTKAPNQYDLAGIDYGKTFGVFKVRVGFHGYFPKSSMLIYASKGNLIPNIGLSWSMNETQTLTSNTSHYLDYSMNSNFFISNLIYKKNLSFGNVEVGQYYNFNSTALSGTLAYSKSWSIYNKLSGFASIRLVWNESSVKQNSSNAVVVNIGVKL